MLTMMMLMLMKVASMATLIDMMTEFDDDDGVDD
jgi:hypothetical protein